MTYVSLEDYLARQGKTPGDLDSADTLRTESKLADADAYVRQIARDGGVTIDPADVAEGEPLETLIPIIITMVDRELANPNDYQSESIGDYSRTTFGGLNATRSQRRAIMRILGIPPWSSQDAQVDIPLPPTRQGISDSDILGVL